MDALEYLAWVGETFGGDYTEKLATGPGRRFSGRALNLHKGMAAIRAYEYEISRALTETLDCGAHFCLVGSPTPLE